MSRTEHNFWLDVTIFVTLLITTITGFILWLVIPHNLDIAFQGFSRSVWVAAHICFGVVGLAGIVLHIVWHWGGSKPYADAGSVGYRTSCVPIVL